MDAGPPNGTIMIRTKRRREAVHKTRCKYVVEIRWATAHPIQFQKQPRRGDGEMDFRYA